MISWSKCRPLKSSCAEVGSVISSVTAVRWPFQVCTRTLDIYRRNWDKWLNEKTFGEITLEDFVAFEKAGLNYPDLSRIKQALGELGSEAPSP